jgi:ADP-heptose:LPS heptosyltransferase
VEGDQVKDAFYNESCRLFNGYRPCFPRYVCDGCTEAKPFDRTILLINLDALGDVLMTTCALAPLRRLYPDALLTWLTLPPHAPLLANNPMIDRVWTFDLPTLTTLSACTFDLILNVDKGRPSCALASSIPAGERRGFGLNPSGSVVPLNEEAKRLYRLGLDDRLKFVVNDRTGQELLADSLGLPYARDPYVLNLTDQERRFVADYRTRTGGRRTVGIQTGTSDIYPLKSFTEDQIVELIPRIRGARGDVTILLLGGPAEAERNARIASRAGDGVVQTPTDEGLRRGILYIDACDVVVSPDSGAMHIAIALRKWVVGWFNISCAQEIDLFDRGIKVTTPLACSPCWRRECPDPICRPIADLDAIVAGVIAGLEDHP